MAKEYTYTKEKLDKTTPGDALNILKEGNKRFLDQNMKDRDYQGQIKITSGGQAPHSFVLACIDSRVTPEYVFDQGVGDIFTGAIAGNVVDGDTLGGMEFACKVAGTKLIVVMGHTACGAVKGACDKVEMGNLTGLLKKIEPAIENTSTLADEKRDSSNTGFVNKVAENNVRESIKNILNGSPVLAELKEKGEIDIVGAMYSVDSGKVSFL